MTPQPSTSLRVKALFERARKHPECTIEGTKLEFTEALCKAMKAQGVSNCQLAKRMGVHKSTIGRTLKGGNITIENIGKAAHALNCNVEIRLVARI